MSFLLDTCVISELASKNPNPKVAGWIDSVDHEIVYLSVITIGEIQRGIELLPASRKRSSLEDWLFERVLIRFRDKIVSVDKDVVLLWGTMTAEMDKAGTPMSALDSLIAASARYHNLMLVTRNTADFKNCGVGLLNPWR
jgi:predicted nucleic acid-binding protein